VSSSLKIYMTYFGILEISRLVNMTDNIHTGSSGSSTCNMIDSFATRPRPGNNMIDIARGDRGTGNVI
jgi:hypothetical protein